MRTQVFAHNGFLGIMSGVGAEGLLNKPKDPGQLGFVVDAEYVDIQPEALELLKKIPKSCDDIGDVDVFKSENGIVFSWLGGPRTALKPDKASGSSSYDPSLLKANPKVETPKDFIEATEGWK